MKKPDIHQNWMFCWTVCCSILYSALPCCSYSVGVAFLREDFLISASMVRTRHFGRNPSIVFIFILNPFRFMTNPLLLNLPDWILPSVDLAVCGNGGAALSSSWRWIFRAFRD